MYSFVDGDTGGMEVTIYSGASITHPIIADGVNVLTVRTSDGFLMNNAVALADPAVAFDAARSGAGYCFGLAGYGEIIWLASNAGVTTNFIAMRTTGGVWEDKTGDFNTAIGAWAGSSVSVTALPLTCSI